jgi:hypothetical protein
MKTMPTQIAKLTEQENYVWIQAFCFHRDRCKTDLQADKLAWRDVAIEFPRLKKFGGCK